MDIEQLTALCLAKPGAGVEHPFGPGARVVKVGGRMFALLFEDADPAQLNLKCDPEIAVALREAHTGVTPGYHMNKRHWNTVALDGSVTAEEVAAWIEDSYDLVVAGLPRRDREALPSRA